MAAKVNMVLASTHNHIKITTNYRTEPPEIKLKESSTTMKIKKKPHEDW